MSARGLPLIAVALVLGGGCSASRSPRRRRLRPARRRRPVPGRAARTAPRTTRSLAETVVLLGLDSAACRLGVSRERLVLALPSQKDRAELARRPAPTSAASRRRSRTACTPASTGSSKTGQLPKLSALLPSIADQLGISKSLVGADPRQRGRQRCSRPPTCCAGRSTSST